MKQEKRRLRRKYESKLMKVLSPEDFNKRKNAIKFKVRKREESSKKVLTRSL